MNRSTTAPAAPAPRRRRHRHGWRQWGPGVLLISPSLLLVGLFVYGMIGVNVRTSMMDTHRAAQISGRKPSGFVGLENFTTLFSDPNFQHSLKNLVLFTAAFLVGTLVIGFLWAWLLDKPVKGEGIFRSVFLFPMAVSFVASGVVWRWLLNSGTGESATGLNRLFEMTGLTFLENAWTQNTSWGILAIALPAVWQLSGYVMALFLAGFRGINDDLREAARVDGADEGTDRMTQATEDGDDQDVDQRAGADRARRDQPVVPGQQDAADAGDQPGHGMGGDPVGVDGIAQRVHSSRVVTDALEGDAERRAQQIADEEIAGQRPRQA